MVIGRYFKVETSPAMDWPGEALWTELTGFQAGEIGNSTGLPATLPASS